MDKFEVDFLNINTQVQMHAFQDYSLVSSQALCSLFFSSALLRYNWHVTLCKLKKYNMLIWYTYITEILSQWTLASASCHIITICFLFCFGLFKLQCLSSQTPYWQKLIPFSPLSSAWLYAPGVNFPTWFCLNVRVYRTDSAGPMYFLYSSHTFCSETWITCSKNWEANLD